MVILTDNDWSRLSRALREMREDKLSVTLGKATVEVWTTNVKRGWPVAMLVGLRVEAGHMVQRQYFESVEAARMAEERWKYLCIGGDLCAGDMESSEGV